MQDLDTDWNQALYDAAARRGNGSAIDTRPKLGSGVDQQPLGSPRQDL